MTAYLAFTQAASAWFLGHSRELEACTTFLASGFNIPALGKAVLSAGPLRIAASPDNDVLAFWHAEYLSSSGTDGWGYIKLSGKHGALCVANRFESVLRTALQVFEARLQGLLLSDTVLVRPHGDDIFTCVAGKGQTKDSSIGYLESSSGLRKTVIVVGPEVADGRSLSRSHGTLVRTLENDIKPELHKLVGAAPSIVEQARRRPAVDDPRLSALRRALLGESPEPAAVIVAQPQLRGTFRAMELDYASWVAPDSPLSADKRRILESDIIDQQPLRISGPAGSGKTLLLQLMAVRVASRKQPSSSSILFIAHNSESALRAKVSIERLCTQLVLPTQIQVATLHQLCVERLGLPSEVVLDADALETKRYQMAMFGDALQKELSGIDTKRLPLLAQAQQKGEIFDALVFLISHEVSSVIKPLRLYEDPRRYSDSERPLSRFHGLLSPTERRVVLNVFNYYHQQVFEQGGLLDSDDLALSLLSRLRTPVWNLQRKTEGFDYVFIDEAQLYNENERRLFPALAKPKGHVPLAIAIDEAQGFGSGLNSGFAALGIGSFRDEALHSVFRTTESILRLAFNLIQQTTDLFGPDFPDFTRLSASVVKDDREYPLPAIYRAGLGESLANAVLRHVRDLRRALNMRHIGVIVMTDRYYGEIGRALRESELQVLEIAQRSQRFDLDRPLVALCTPRLAGGQEFDAVVVVGVERGVVPPRVSIEGLAASLEQQAYRELYISFTRAKYVVRIVNSQQSEPSAVLSSAQLAGLLSIQQ